jgi:Rho-binding antiterminator
MSDYRPIPCALYDRYERAIMHRDRLRVRWRDDAGITHLETLFPADLETCNGEEFLVAIGLGGEALRLRLDRIVDAEPLDADRAPPLG